MRRRLQASGAPLQAWAMALAAVCCWPTIAVAEPAPASEQGGGDRYELQANSSTYVRMFERALIPGPGGASVETETLIPVHEYVTLRVVDLDAPWGADALDMELAAWSSALLGSAEGEHALDGDVTTANMTGRLGAARLTLGRQMVAAGTVRLLHFDGLSVGVRSDLGVGLSGYAGATVLPRWSERPGYRHLGSAADSLLTSPDALPEPERAGYWLAGIRADYVADDLGSVGVSFHEEREQSDLARRDLGADLKLLPWDELEASASGLLDLDSVQLALASVILDVYPIRDLDLAAEYRRTDPALLMSRQSVLSVFSTDRFDEVGTTVRYRVLPELQVSPSAYLQFFDPGSMGSRLGLDARLSPDPTDRLLVLLSYGRVDELENGYHSGRAALRYRIVEPLRATVEHYSYFYDEPIAGISSSTVEGANLEWDAATGLSLMLGGSLSRTPYAALDAQTLLRVSYDVDLATGGGR